MVFYYRRFPLPLASFIIELAVFILSIPRSADCVQHSMFALWSRPFDGDQIVPRVFLGSACTKESALTENEITHVVSVAKEHGVPVCRSVAHYFVVHVDDDPDENLLAVLDQCVAYIDNALNSSEDTRVFVHWYVHAAARRSSFPAHPPQALPVCLAQ